MSDKTRQRAAAQAIADQDRRRLNTFHEAQARDALTAADAHDAANGVHRVSVEQIQNLARRLMDADIMESLEVLDTLAKGDLAPLAAAVKEEQ